MRKIWVNLIIDVMHLDQEARWFDHENHILEWKGWVKIRGNLIIDITQLDQEEEALITRITFLSEKDEKNFKKSYNWCYEFGSGRTRLLRRHKITWIILQRLKLLRDDRAGGAKSEFWLWKVQ